MSQYSANAAAGIASHQTYFGESVEFKANASAAWVPIANASIHREEIKQRKTANGWQKVVSREVFCSVSQVSGIKLLSQLKIGSTTYTIEGVTNRSADRVCLHLIRVGAMEVARPDYRMR